MSNASTTTDDRFDAIAWARAAPKAPPGPRCATCAAQPVRDFVRAVLEERIAGRSEATARQMHCVIVERHAWTQTYDGFLRHLRDCETDLWRRSRGVVAAARKAARKARAGGSR